MNNSLFLKVGALLVVLIASTNATVGYSFETSSSLIKNEVTKRDAFGRVEVMETRTSKGSCIAQIVYDDVPKIYVVVASRTKLQNIGFLQINDGTKESLTDTVLMRLFRKAIVENCFPLIVPGYAIT